MHSNVKNWATFCIILAVIHAFMGIAVIIYSGNYGLPFAQKFVLTAYIFASMVACVILSCALRTLCSNLEIEYEGVARDQRALRKRIEALEFKVGQ